MQYALIVLLLTACGYSPSRLDSPLISAARSGDAARVTQLVKQGADPNQHTDVNGWPALLHAVHKHQLATAAALLDAGADPNRGDPHGATPLDYARDGINDIDRFTLLRCQDDAARALLAADPAQPRGKSWWARVKRCA